MSQSLFEHVIFDIETNGLLPAHVEPPFCMDRIHCLSIKDVVTGEKVSYVNDDLWPLSVVDIAELSNLGHKNIGKLSDGVVLLNNAKTLIGHNIIDFDIPAIELIYEDFDPMGRIIDTLVMARMCFADIKEKDFRLAAKGQLEGRLIGLQGLEAWGQRLGLAKGDYKKDRELELKERHKELGKPAPTVEELHHYVWGTWNVAMHDYMVLDVDVNDKVWQNIDVLNWSPEATRMEHEIHALMVQQERNGFYFDLEKGTKLGDHLQEEYAAFADKAVEEIGRWYRPARWHGEEDINEEHGEDDSRRSWGNVDSPKRTISYLKSNGKLDGDYRKMRASTVEGVPYTKVELRDFNPNSRQQIVDRLSHLYGWTPQDFTEKGSARVDDEILRNLADEIPLAKTLAEIFYYKKRIGMVVDGKNGWLKLVRPDQRIHGRVNVGGTVTGRATHAAPNISQVPGVTILETKDYDQGLDWIVKHKDEGTFVDASWKEKKGEWAIYVRGREGNHGWDCRELFTVPKDYKLVGCDLSGVEFRCLANLTFPFDDGELVEIVLNGDIHQINADLMGVSRSVAKRLLYACVPMDTTALTKDGWKTYDELSVGEEILTYNSDKNQKEWKPVLDKVKFEDEPVTEIFHKSGWSIRSTPDHRWFVRRRVEESELNAPVHIGLSKYSTDWTEKIIQMSNQERQSFLAGFCIADGYWDEKGGRTGKWRWSQNVGEFSEAALTASYMEWGGYVPTSIRYDTPNPLMTARQNLSPYIGLQTAQKKELPAQDVWCVTTENSSWIMRQGNHITITGNCMYGGGMAKLGSIAEPLSSEGRQTSLGKTLHAKLMTAMPSLRKAIQAIHKEARRNHNTIAGLDNRRLFVRSKHAALNMRLQSDGALIAKKWCLLVDDMFYEEGWTHGVGHEYAFCSWSHDEIQVSVREDLAERAAEIMEEAAAIAGDHFKFNCPITAEAKIGDNWAMTH